MAISDNGAGLRAAFESAHAWYTNAKPDIGWPLGRKQVELDGVVARETYRFGKLIGWHDLDQKQPIIEYPNGKKEVVFSLSETNWRA